MKKIDRKHNHGTQAFYITEGLNMGKSLVKIQQEWNVKKRGRLDTKRMFCHVVRLARDGDITDTVAASLLLGFCEETK